MHFIYKILNTINNKIYIGQTNDPSLRWSQHKSSAKYKRGNQVITRAISKYGASVFEFEVIATCQTQDDADFTEEQVIQQYGSMNLLIGYNIAAGGNTSIKTPEILKKMSDGLNKYYETHESHMKGRILTEEWKANMSKASMGKPGTNVGRAFDNDWIMKISKAQTGKEQKTKRRFSEEIEKEICRLYVDEEKSTYWLGKNFNSTRGLILSILDRNNIKRRQSNYTGHLNNRNIFTIEQELEICRIYGEGKISRRSLAKQFNCGKTTIRGILLRNNIKF